MRIEDAKRTQLVVRRAGVPWQDFRMVLLGALVLLALVAFGEQIWFLPPLRLMLGLAYVLYVPGYCLTAALFPQIDDLDGVERVGLSIGLSIALVSLLALLLDRLPWGLQLWPILLGEYGMAALFASIALWRRSQLPAAAVYVPALTWRSRLWWQSLPPPEPRIYTLLAGALLLVSLLAAWIFLVPSPDEFMTEFYILGKAGLAEDYPRLVAPDDDLMVTMGIANRERDQHSYRVEVWVVDSFHADRRALVVDSGPFPLQPGEERRSPVSWRMPWIGDDQKVEFLLFNNADPSPYRQLRLWVNVRPRSVLGQ